MQLRDALFNWLQIQIVWDARPSDRSAKDSALFFEQILREDHQVESLTKRKQKEAACYEVEFEQNGNKQTMQFPAEAAEQLLNDILNEPKYNQMFE